MKFYRKIFLVLIYIGVSFVPTYTISPIESQKMAWAENTLMQVLDGNAVEEDVMNEALKILSTYKPLEAAQFAQAIRDATSNPTIIQEPVVTEASPTESEIKTAAQEAEQVLLEIKKATAMNNKITQKELTDVIEKKVESKSLLKRFVTGSWNTLASVPGTVGNTIKNTILKPIFNTMKFAASFIVDRDVIGGIKTRETDIDAMNAFVLKFRNNVSSTMQETTEKEYKILNKHLKSIESLLLNNFITTDKDNKKMPNQILMAALQDKEIKKEADEKVKKVFTCVNSILRNLLIYPTDQIVLHDLSKYIFPEGWTLFSTYVFDGAINLYVICGEIVKSEQGNVSMQKLFSPSISVDMMKNYDQNMKFFKTNAKYIFKDKNEKELKNKWSTTKKLVVAGASCAVVIGGAVGTQQLCKAYPTVSATIMAGLGTVVPASVVNFVQSSATSTSNAIDYVGQGVANMLWSAWSKVPNLRTPKQPTISEQPTVNEQQIISEQSTQQIMKPISSQQEYKENLGEVVNEGAKKVGAQLYNTGQNILNVINDNEAGRLEPVEHNPFF